MPVTVGRRELIAGLGSAMAWPLAAHAQQPAMPVIGVLQGDTNRGPGLTLARTVTRRSRPSADMGSK